MDFWQKLTMEWPCRLGDWLWANIAVPLSTLPRQMTLRRVIFLAAFLVAAGALAHIVTADAALYMAGDIAFYCELASAVMFIVIRGHVRHVVHVAQAVLKHAARRAAIWCRRSIGARRHRKPRKPAAPDADCDGDGIAGWLPGLAAYRVLATQL